MLHKYSLPKDYLFYPAQFWSHKNHVNLLHALKVLEERDGLLFPLVFVGTDCGNQEYVRSIAGKLNLQDRVHFLGFVPREDLIGLYQNALALTYVSLCGPENLPPLEAFALGCPVIASRISGAQEQLGDAALLVDPTDIEGLATAIKSIYADQDRRQKLICSGKERAAGWTAKHYVQELLKFFDSFELVRRCWPV